MTDLSALPGVRTLLAPNPSPMTLDGTRTFVVGRERPAVVDPGPGHAAHLDAVVEALGGARPAAILLTHAHADHAAGAPALAARTGAPILAAADGFAGAGRRLADGETVETDAGTMEAVATPGHAPDHLAFLWRGGEAPEGGALLVGDLFMGEGDTTLVAPPEGDLSAYLRSLDRVEALAPALLLPAHGPPLRDPAEAVRRFRRHRVERIEQAAEALARAGRAGPAALVDAVYGDALPPALRPAAAGSLAAILEHLRAAGRATRAADGAYQLVETP